MRKIIIIGLILIWASCVTNRRIIYKTMDIQVNQDKKLSSIVLDIEDFIDKRKDSPDNKILFINDEQCGYEGRQVCINTERYYLKESVAHQATHMLVEHLNKRNSFKIVVQNKKDTADYYITGNLIKFYGIQDFSTGAALAQDFGGAIGAVATSHVKTKGKIIFELTELKIYNKNRELIKDLGTFKKEYDDVFPFTSNYLCIYNSVNLNLKNYFSELVTVIETEIENKQ